MTKIFQVRSNTLNRFFPDRDTALSFARTEYEGFDKREDVEVEAITLISASPAIVACALLEGGYCAEGKTIKLYRKRKD